MNTPLTKIQLIARDELINQIAELQAAQLVLNSKLLALTREIKPRELYLANIAVDYLNRGIDNAIKALMD